jgi:hypothetical protein
MRALDDLNGNVEELSIGYLYTSDTAKSTCATHKEIVILPVSSAADTRLVRFRRTHF